MNIYRVDTFYSANDDGYEVAAWYLFQAEREPTKEQITAWFIENRVRAWPDFRVIGPIAVHTL